MPSDYIIRPLDSRDEPILWEMLFQGLQAAAGDTTLSIAVVRQPEHARYVEGWGRSGDRGFVAQQPESHQLMGAVWYREAPAGETPELAVVVGSGHRNRGIGAALLTQWVRANPEQSEIALRMSASNPAVRLYERFGFHVAQEQGDCVTLRREG